MGQIRQKINRVYYPKKINAVSGSLFEFYFVFNLIDTDMEKIDRDKASSVSNNVAPSEVN